MDKVQNLKHFGTNKKNGQLVTTLEKIGNISGAPKAKITIFCGFLAPSTKL